MRCSVPDSRRLLAGSALWMLTGAVVAQPQSEVAGRWQTIDDETGEVKSVVELAIEDRKLYGTVVELFRDPDQDPNPICNRCPGPQQGQPVIGMRIVDGLRWREDAWTDGTILDPEKGKRYDVKIWLDKGLLKVRGYLGIFFRTQTWRRAD